MSNPREDQILFAIGWMSDSFARLEASTVDFFAHLVNPRNIGIGELISDRLSLSQTIGFIRDLLKKFESAEVQQEFAALSRDIESASSTRNDIMHSSWATPAGDDDTDCEILQERARKRHLGPNGHELEALLKKMEEETFFIQDVEMRLRAFSRRFSQIHGREGGVMG